MHFKKINTLNDRKKEWIHLAYDTEDCGCGVNGMPTFELKDQIEDNEKRVSCDQFSVSVHYQQAVFFAKEMTLDFNGQTFRLSSPEGVLNPFIPPSVIGH